MTLAPQQTGALISRYFTIEGVHPDDEITWARRDARLANFGDGSVVFEQTQVEFPESWSVNASNIVAQKYFRGQLGTSTREWSLRQVIDRVVETIARWGESAGYFADSREASTFRAELSWLLLHQRASFNSPVWFNIGVDGVPQQSSACFILSVDDTMESILNWYVEEGTIFRGGSGAGVNLSDIRSSRETMSGGGTPSGPVSFMRGADASAGTIKSGGKTRRAAKMVVLDVDHPDVGEFIWCKAREERKARVLIDAGFDMGFDGDDAHSIQYQNANNSVRLSDEFMQAVVDDEQWDLVARTDGTVIDSVSARELMSQIAEAAWECADPGVQFSTTINSWHTSPTAGPISASNPCSEYLHLDNSACNLASINLLSFLDDDGVFDVDGFAAASRVLIIAQDILVTGSAYPTEKIDATTRRYRQLGLGFTNLGALLMALGQPYDSTEGRSTAGSIAALMTGEAYRTSAELAARVGPYEGYAADRESMLDVLHRHRACVDAIEPGAAAGPIIDAARATWDEACASAADTGVRNAQATVLAPTGTISFMMDCDTTGIEPDFALVKHKVLAGGGSMAIVNNTVGRALRGLGYDADEVDDIIDHISTAGSVVGAPHLRDEHAAIFACSIGQNAITAEGHVAMMAAVQPFLSGGISKTVNLPESATAIDIEDLFVSAWRQGVKAVAVYRDNCKVSQPLSSVSNDSSSGEEIVGGPAGHIDAITEAGTRSPVREKMPRSRRSRTFEFRVADCKGWITVGEYDDGRPGEIFAKVSKQGSTLAGIMDAFAISLSHGLQYGVPLTAFVEAFVGMRFDPAGITDDPDVRIATSLIDYLFRRLAIEYLSPDERAQLNIFTTEERAQPTLPGVVEAATPSSPGDMTPDPRTPSSDDASLFDEVDPVAAVAGAAVTPTISVADAAGQMCMQCGTVMIRAGSCYVCSSCGNTSGCS